MGTRSLTRFIETHTETNKRTKKEKTVNEEIVVMYRQYDGYPEGHGLELAEFLADGEMVNGFGLDDKKVFNGMGCLAAQVVANFKSGPGGIYLHKAGTTDCWEEYDYHVVYNSDTKVLTIKCYTGGGELLFEGTPKEFIENVETINK
jgi:hypothetical protein